MGCVCVCVLREHDGQVTFSCIFIVCQRLCSFAFPICMALICLYFIHIYIYICTSFTWVMWLGDLQWTKFFFFFPSYSSKMAVFSFVTGWGFFLFFFTLFELSMICYAYCWHIEVNAFPTVITDLILLIFNTTLVVCLVFLFRKHKYIFLQIKYCLFYLLLYYYISRVYTKKTFW